MSDRLDSRLVLALAFGAFGFVLLLATVSDCGNIERAAAADIAPQQASIALPPPETQESSAVEVEPMPPTQRELGAALILARYAANEAGFGARGDMLLIWQVAETHADDLEGRVRWLRLHSRCVVAIRAPDEWPAGNCRWARHLDRSGRAPRGWSAGARRWRRDAPRWAESLAFALTVVRGEELRRPCDGEPQTWDGRRWLAGRTLIGYEEVSCLDPWTGEPLANVAYRFPPWRRPGRARRRTAPRTAVVVVANPRPAETPSPF